MNISPQSVTALRDLGWDIIRVTAVLPHNAPDDEILAWARDNDRVLVTQDLDFSTLLALSGFSQPSLITLRLNNADPDSVTEKLLMALEQHESILAQGYAVTVTPFAIRTRKLPVR